MIKPAVEFEFAVGDIVVAKPTGMGNSSYNREPQQWRVVTIVAEDMGGGGGFNKLYRCRRITEGNGDYGLDNSVAQFTETEVMTYEAYKVSQKMIQDEQQESMLANTAMGMELKHELDKYAYQLKIDQLRKKSGI